jgi:arylsulfatase A-like enzyme
VDAHQVFYTADRAEGDAARSDALPDVLDTMAEWMKGNGYETLGLQTNANLTAELGFSQGFDNYLFENCARADWVTGRATERLKNLKKPFFLYMHFMDPHAPFDPPDTHREVFGPLPAISPEEQAIVDQSIPYVLDVAYDTMGLVAQRRFPALSPEGRETIWTRYDADCRYMDDELDKFLAMMRAEYPNTLFVVLADHGEEFWEHNSLGHGHTVYQEQIAVPFFIHGPGIQPGEVTQPAGTIHLLPTLAAYLKYAPQPNWQGRNLLAGLDPDAPAFTTTHGAFPRVKIHKEAVRVGSMKLIFQPETGDEKLYDLASDPGETADLAAAQPETVARLRALLTQHLKDNYSHRKGKRNEVRLSPEVLEQLRLNGYGGQDEPAADGDKAAP